MILGSFSLALNSQKNFCWISFRDRSYFRSQKDGDSKVITEIPDKLATPKVSKIC